jgi:SAM-dependent methyltransferase
VAFEELKQKASVAWGAAPFEKVEPEIRVMHDHLLARLEPGPGERWLDLACGAGAVAMLAAREGAIVTGVDFAPGLIEAAKRRAAEQGLPIDYLVADCEDLPFENGGFDVVSSSVGFIFAPDHAAAARELARVTKPGGRIGITAWEMTGSFAELFELQARFQPPPPEGAGSPFEWGRREHAEDLLGDAFQLEFDEGDAPQTGESGRQIWELYLSAVGPFKTLYDSLEPERREELQREIVDFFEGFRANGGISQPRPYLLILGTRR